MKQRLGDVVKQHECMVMIYLRTPSLISFKKADKSIVRQVSDSDYLYVSDGYSRPFRYPTFLSLP